MFPFGKRVSNGRSTVPASDQLTVFGKSPRWDALRRNMSVS